ncbi:MAG: response regulator [Rhizobacter sp.]|nr:response regulator [Ferruginibacter sp.]
MKQLKILVIDDEEDLRNLLKSYFEKNNCLVMLAGTLDAGMAALDNFKPDHIFLDNNLPDGSGWSKTQHILMNYPQCQLNLMSGHLVPKTSAMNFRIVEKPISFKDLDMIIQIKNSYKWDTDEEVQKKIKISGENNTQFKLKSTG